MVFDPAGLVIGAALGMAFSGSPGLVSINGLPPTNCGTEVWGELGIPHLPVPGILFFASGLPTYTGNDAELFFGSYNVSIGGSYGVRLGEIAASCSDPIRMPTSLVLAIPKGLPVLNLAPMAPDLAMIAQQLALRGLASLGRRGARLFRQFQEASPFFRRLSHALGGCEAPPLAGRLRQMWARATRFVTGHPVDVVTGNLFTEIIDVELPGPLPLTIERVYESAGSDRQSTLGFGWNHSLDESMWLERGRLVVRLGDGREIEFGLWHLPERLVRPGDVLVNVAQKMRLHCLAPDRFELEFWDKGLIHVFRVLKRDRESPAGTPRARLMEITTRTRDHAIRLNYNEAGDLETVIDSAGRTLAFEHDALGRLTGILLPVPHGPGLVRRRTFHYDDAGDLVEVRDARGASYRYEYQGHLLVQETDRAGLSFYFQYDGQGASSRCIRTWGDGGIYDHVIHYNAPARATLVEDSCGATKLYTFDAQNRVLSLTDAHGAKTTFEYDEATSEVVREVMPTGRTMSTEVNALGKPTRLSSSDGWALALSYEATGELASMTDHRGRTWRWERDAAGRLLRRVEADGTTAHFSWRGGLLASVSERGQEVHFEYDEAKNVQAIRDARGGESKYAYDRLGQLTKLVNPLGSASRYRYDAEGHLTDVESKLDLLQRSTFDAEGNLLDYVDANRHVRFEYGHFHRVTAREERAGFPIGAGQQRARVVYEYDTEDRLKAVINEAGERYEYALDLLGRATAEVGFDGRIRATQRDAKGVIRKTRSPNGTTMSQ